jgi:K+-transporting ATPase A subunit
MLALPVIGWNAIGNFTNSNGLQPFDNESKITNVITGVKIVQPYLTPFQISARDDRIKDCLRSGNCKN